MGGEGRAQPAARWSPGNAGRRPSAPSGLPESFLTFASTLLRLQPGFEASACFVWFVLEMLSCLLHVL